MLRLNTVSLVNEVLDLIACHKSVKFTAAAPTVLDLGHFDFVLDFSHLRCALSDRLKATHAITDLTYSHVPVLVGLQNCSFLSLLQKVGRAHLHAFDVHLVLERKFL